ncbi:MAG: hypothetical protein H0W22_08480 [Chloroflexi bacterium]|nr:hypothetical protein [Chloroflexota bacterium]
MQFNAGYLVADRTGTCLHGTAAALDLLGMTSTTLRRLKVGDLFPGGAPRSLSRLLESVTESAAWTTTETDVIRGDGTTIRANLASLRTPTGELVLRLTCSPVDVSTSGDVREVLQAWRREELQLAASTPGTPEHLLADVEAQRLSAEYRRLVAAVADAPPKR